MSTKGVVGKRIVCLCDDCQTYAHFLGRAHNLLDQNGGTEIVPTAPANLRIAEGLEHLKCVRLSPKGMYRFYASCCQTPIGNVMASTSVPYVGLNADLLKFENESARLKTLGPLYARMMGKFGKPPLPQGTYPGGSMKVIVMALAFLAKVWLFRRTQPSPFFIGNNVSAPVQVLEKSERLRLKELALASTQAGSSIKFN